jgi:GNAT superfamily N-acetyltransferase
VGYLYAYIDRNSVYINPKAKLDAMYVEENYRNKEVATGLITYFENWVEEKNITIIEVSVCVLNNKALNLYMKTGYQEYKKILYKKKV